MVVKIFDKDWGFLTFEASKYKFDFFPRLTMVTIPHVMEISFGFLCFRLQLSIWSKVMQEFNRNNR